MEYFWTDGGNNRPYFIYRLRVKSGNTGMYEWCKKYPEKGPFSRFHVIWNSELTDIDRREPPIFQFELKDAYLAFQYAFAGEIIEDLTWKEYR